MEMQMILMIKTHDDVWISDNNSERVVYCNQNCGHPYIEKVDDDVNNDDSENLGEGTEIRAAK